MNIFFFTRSQTLASYFLPIQPHHHLADQPVNRLQIQQQPEMKYQQKQHHHNNGFSFDDLNSYFMTITPPSPLCQQQQNNAVLQQLQPQQEASHCHLRTQPWHMQHRQSGSDVPTTSTSICKMASVMAAKQCPDIVTLSGPLPHLDLSSGPLRLYNDPAIMSYSFKADTFTVVKK